MDTSIGMYPIDKVMYGYNIVICFIAKIVLSLAIGVFLQVVAFSLLASCNN